MNRLNLRDKKFLLSVSGGADSLALLLCLEKLVPAGKLGVFHFHHGDFEQKEFRDQAADFVRQLCDKKGIPFFMSKAEVYLKSENAFRKARRMSLQNYFNSHDFDFVVFGHHQQDLLETRLLRLIRGTGPQGLLSMETLKGVFFRPFLTQNPQDLKYYLKSMSQNWIEDPSNSSSKYLRNWMRMEWLPLLEKRQPGALPRLAQSLELLVERSEKLEVPKGTESLCSTYLALSPSQQRQYLAQWFLQLNIQDFTQSHLEEIQKRLDRREKRLNFYVGPVELEVNAGRIRVQKRPSNHL